MFEFFSSYNRFHQLYQMYCGNVCFSRAEFQDVFVNHSFGPFYQVLYLYCFMLYRNKLIANSEDILAPWCSGYHSCTTLFDNPKCSFSSDSNPSRGVPEVCNGESLLKKVPTGNKAQHLSLVNHSSKTVYHYQPL